MELSNQFRVGVPIDEAWATLTDVEGIAPCLPGAQLTEIEGDEYRGQVKIKVGPITAQYKGTASFIEKDDSSYRAVLDAKGRDTRGQGNAAATVTVQLTPDGDGTNASIVTDLKLSGKVAQFGRGVMADVSEKLLGQFVTCLEAKLGEQAASAGRERPRPQMLRPRPRRTPPRRRRRVPRPPRRAPPRPAARRRRPPATVGPAPRRARTARARPPRRPAPAASTCPNPSPSTCSRPPEPRWRSGSRRSWWCCSSC